MTASSSVTFPGNNPGTIATTTNVPQPLNVYKKIPVIRFSNDILSYEDTEGNIKTVSVEELGDAIATATPLQIPRPKLDIPVPRILNVEEYDYDITNDYKIETSYVRYHRQTPDQWNNTTNEYIADLEDEIWLYNNPDFGTAAMTSATASKKTDENNNNNQQDVTANRKRSYPSYVPTLPLRIFEQMMDILEKATAFESIITEVEAEQLFATKLPPLFRMFPTPVSSAATVTINTIPTVKYVIHEVYTYWVNKRSKLKRPLLRKFWPVTSSDDTNPHLVFRPRNEKEKYKLRVRKARAVNAAVTAPSNNVDIILSNTYKKLKLLKDDLTNFTTALTMIVKREEIYQIHVQATVELFEQRLYDTVDTSGLPRESKLLRKSSINEMLEHGIPTYYESATVGKRSVVRLRNPTMNAPIPLVDDIVKSAFFKSYVDDATAAAAAMSVNRSTPADINEAIESLATSATDITSNGLPNYNEILPNIAGKNFGDPAPNFLQPLETREHYITSYENDTTNASVPYVRTYFNGGQIQTTTKFRHRPRIGRGGRVIIDRFPQVMEDPRLQNHPSSQQTIYRAGFPLPNYVVAKDQLLDLLPRPLDHASISRNIEMLSVAAIHEDYNENQNALRQRLSLQQQRHQQQGVDDETGKSGNSATNNLLDAVIVRVEDYLETDDQLWGTEHYTLGPL